MVKFKENGDFTKVGLSFGTHTIYRMTLKYSNDEITDEELRWINLQTAAHQYMMESDAQQKTTPIPFQKTPSPQRPVSPSECYIPDGQNT